MLSKLFDRNFVDNLLFNANFFRPFMVAESRIVKCVPFELSLSILLLCLLLIESRIVFNLIFVPVASFHDMRILAMQLLFNHA